MQLRIVRSCANTLILKTFTDFIGELYKMHLTEKELLWNLWSYLSIIVILARISAPLLQFFNFLQWVRKKIQPIKRF